jgi:hypothetical protein
MLVVFAACAVLHLSAWPAAPSTYPFIVKRLVLQNQTASQGSQIDPVLLFTPDHDALYRVTVIIQSVGGVALCPLATNNVCVSGGVTLSNGKSLPTVENSGQASTNSYLLEAGAQVSYFATVAPSNVLPYDLVVVIEEL